MRTKPSTKFTSTTTRPDEDYGQAESEQNSPGDEEATAGSAAATASARRENGTGGERQCAPPAINDFPSDLLSQTQRRFGAIIFHLVFAVYLFLSLMKVCDDYFMPSVEIIGQVDYTFLIECFASSNKKETEKNKNKKIKKFPLL